MAMFSDFVFSWRLEELEQNIGLLGTKVELYTCKTLIIGTSHHLRS